VPWKRIVILGPIQEHGSLLAEDRCGSKTEVSGLARHVRFTLKSGHRQAALIRLFGAKCGREATGPILTYPALKQPCSICSQG
jgi:hypothetical protein